MKNYLIIFTLSEVMTDEDSLPPKLTDLEIKYFKKYNVFFIDFYEFP